jgi:hypothetical protein
MFLGSVSNSEAFKASQAIAGFAIIEKESQLTIVS